MAIKVKHEGNVTSRITAASAGGQGKRAADDGKAWAQIAAGEAQAANQQLQGAHASPVSPGHASAQLTHAPTGAAPGIMHAPSGVANLGGMGGAGRTGTGSGTGAGAQQRIGDVKNSQQMELLGYQHDNAMKRAEQNALLNMEREVLGAKLKLPGKITPQPQPAIRSPFATMPDEQTGTPPAELYNILDKIDPRLIDIREQFKNGGIQEPFDNAMSVALATLSSDGMSGGITPSELGRGGNGTVGEVFDAIMAQKGGGTPSPAPRTQSDWLSGVYGSGGSIYERGGESGVKPLSWLRSPDMDVAAGGDSAAANAYADGMEGMINALMRRV